MDPPHPILIGIRFWLGCNNVAREVVSARPTEQRTSLWPEYTARRPQRIAQMMIALLQMSIIVGLYGSLFIPHPAFICHRRSVSDFECGHLDWLIDFLECSSGLPYRRFPLSDSRLARWLHQNIRSFAGLVSTLCGGLHAIDGHLRHSAPLNTPRSVSLTPLVGPP